MPADLSGVRRKLARAKDKLDKLTEVVETYLDTTPFRITVDVKGNHQAIVCRVDHEPEESWADDMAEIAYQARSALDVLMPQLVVAGGNSAKRGTQFPIFLDQAGYVAPGRGGASSRDKMLKGVATRYRKIIEDFQPYQRGRGAWRDPLAVLQTISNRDKHNDVYVCVAAAEAFAIKIVRPPLPPPDNEVTVRFGDKLVPYGMTDNQEMFSLDWNPDPTDAKRPMTDLIRLEPFGIKPTLGFSSDGRTFTLGDLDRGVLMAAQILDKCAARIKP
jgi:hypothetical protein